ncbi:MAG TPA: hypothetical protein VLF21_01610 [Candidatus Saccharimonadales bacterium]|nr:hypothetical protein [Candidatus Saccharimonadales bacterium]
MAKKEDYNDGGIAFIGCIVAGAGIGWAVNPSLIAPGTLIGLGVGFIAMALLARR